MLKPFYNRKVNIDDRLVPTVTAEDAGKVLVVGEDGKITTGDAGGGKYQHVLAVLLNATTTLTCNVYFSIVTDRANEYTDRNDLIADMISVYGKGNLMPGYGIPLSCHYLYDGVCYLFDYIHVDNNDKIVSHVINFDITNSTISSASITTNYPSIRQDIVIPL